ncbi:type IV secretion system protein VirB3 (plasmid) [Sphaerotilaceae bacterium SBD11-9]
MDDGQDLIVDPLFVGLTRPAMALGVPYFALVAEGMAVVIVFLAIGSPLYLLLAAPVHAVLYLICAHDPYAFDSIVAWMKTNSRCRTSRFWGGASFSPLPMKRQVK